MLQRLLFLAIAVSAGIHMVAVLVPSLRPVFRTYAMSGDEWLLLLIGQYPNGPLGGIAATLLLSILGIALAFPLSVLIALARISSPQLRACWRFAVTLVWVWSNGSRLARRA